MLRYIVRLVARSILTIVLVTAFIFFLYRLAPSHGSTVIPSITATPAQIANLEAQPAIIQYLRLLGQWATGNFGYFPEFNEPISAILAQALPETAVLVLSALILTFLIAIPAGILQGLRHGGIFDQVATGVEYVFFCAPLIVTAPLLTGWFTYNIHLLPPEAPPGNDIVSVLTHFNAMVLPITVLALPSIGRLSRYVRSAVLDQISFDYIVVARAKGCGPFRIVRKHILRNAMIPILTFMGVSIPLILSGGVVVEALFNLRGLGYLLMDAGNPKHLWFSIEVSVLVVTAAVLVVTNLIIDITLAALDPRITR